MSDRKAFEAWAAQHYQGVMGLRAIDAAWEIWMAATAQAEIDWQHLAARAAPPSEPVIDTCEMGHQFAKLPDHPRRDGAARCPHCMAEGLDVRAAENERLRAALEKARTWINAGPHLPAGWEDECYVCQRVAAIDAALKGAI